MTQVLDGIKVVELAMYAFVPSAGAALSDWGAAVIKIEHPETGDPVRGLESYGFKPGDGGVTALWELFNRGKKSVGIDVGTADGLEVLLRLVDEADVFLTSFLPAARRRLGIDDDKIMERNPRIIYARGSGHGTSGPDAEKGGFDGITYWGRSGAGTASTPPGYDFPVMLPGPAFGDMQSGMHLAGGVAAALYKRERTGAGSVVDVSLLGSGLWAMSATIAGAHVRRDTNIEQLDRRKPPNPLGNLYRTKDGRFFMLGFLQPDRYWARLCDVLGRDDLAADPRFGDMRTRGENSAACVAALDDTFGSMTFAETQELLDQQDGPWSEIGFPIDALDDADAHANHYLEVVEYEDGNTLPMVRVPVQLAGESLKPLTRAPQHGEHTDEVVSALGYDEDALMALKIAGVIT
jgi:crotonobetainyl-CoA:carnitine CoA-transferase CaiB-like acyl-CoA transferase